MTPRVVLFDIDGTLLVTRGAGRRALDRAFLDLHGIKDAWQGGSFKGMTDSHIFSTILQHHLGTPATSEAVTKLEERYLLHFEKEIAVAPGYEIMAGVIPLLTALSNSGKFFLGLETGNVEPAAWMKLNRGALHSFFSFGGFSSDSSDRSEIMRTALRRAERKLETVIDPSSVLVIGDARQDVIAAKTIGATVVAVLNGTGKRSDFEDLKPDVLVETLADTGSLEGVLGMSLSVGR